VLFSSRIHAVLRIGRISPRCFLTEWQRGDKSGLTCFSYLLCFVVRFIESFSFVGTSRVTGCEDQRKNCLICVGWGIVNLNLHASAFDLVF